MKRTLALLLLGLLLAAPLADASPSVIATSERAVMMGGEMGPVGVWPDLRVPVTRGQLNMPFLVVDADNPLNLSVRNMDKKWWNATISVANLTGVTLDAESWDLQVPPMGEANVMLVARPADIGKVIIELTSDMPLPQSGEPWNSQYHWWVIPPVTVAFLEPAPLIPDTEGGQRISHFGGDASKTSAFARLRPGEPFEPRLEIRNLAQTSVQGFTLELEIIGPGVGTGPSRVEVPPLEPGERREVTLPEKTLGDERGGHSYFGMVYSYQLHTKLNFEIGSTRFQVSAASFALQSGAVADVLPATGTLEVRSGVAIDLIVPESFTLGVPARIRFNATNYEETISTGRVLITVRTPHGLYYEVQGPQSHEVDVNLAPQESRTGAIEFTPRVSGTWNIEPMFVNKEGGRFNWGGGHFEVPGPVSIRIQGDGSPIHARLNEPVDVDVSIETTETLTDARMAVAAMTGSYFGGGGTGVGQERPGLAHNLLKTTTTGSSTLGTLRPGGTVNTTFEVVSGASGRYTVVPYVVSGGFAYTSGGVDPNMGMPMPMTPDGGPMHMAPSFVQLAVQPRPISSAWGIMPLALGLGIFIGTWTLRTRFVK